MLIPKMKKIINDIINPTPGLFVDDTINLNNQFKNNNNIDRTFTLLKTLKD